MEAYFQFLDDPDGQHTVHMRYSRDDEMWIVRKARQISRATGCPWPVAQIQAHTAFKDLQDRPKAPVISLQQERLARSTQQASSA